MTKINALLVEDNDLARMVAEVSLKKVNCKVDSVSTGEEAVQLALTKKYDIIFMDIGLGDTDGFQVTQTIRSESQFNKDTLIVALTAHLEESYREKAKAVGINDQAA